MVEPTPASPLVMIQSKRSLQLLVVSLDPPAQFRKPNELLHLGIGRHRRQPELRGPRFTVRPFGNQPFDLPRLVQVHIPVSRANPQPEKSRSHLTACSFSPADIAPHPRGSMSCNFQNWSRLPLRTASDSRWWAACSRFTLRRQWFHTRRPNRGFLTYSDHVWNLSLGQCIPERSDNAISCIGQDRRRGQSFCTQAVDHVQRDLPFGLELEILRHSCRKTSFRVFGPGLRQVEPIRRRHAHGFVGQRKTHGYLAVVLFSKYATVLPGHADRMLPLLGNPSVVDDPARDRTMTFHRIEHAVSGQSQHGRILPCGIRNEMMHRLVPRADMPWINASRHRLDALPIACETQPSTVCSKRPGTIGMPHNHKQEFKILLKPLLGGVGAFAHADDHHIAGACPSSIL